METQHHTKSTFLECTEHAYFRDVQVVLDGTDCNFVSPILETKYVMLFHKVCQDGEYVSSTNILCR